MFSSPCVWKGRALKLWRPVAALLIALIIVMASLYNTCSSCNSNSVLWLSLPRHPAAPTSSSSSLIAPEFSSIRKPNSSSPELDTSDNSSDYELGGDDVDHALNASFGNSAHILEISGPQELGFVEKSRNSSQQGEFLKPPDQHRHESPKARRVDQDLSGAKQAIANAASNIHTDLHAPLYHNLTFFIKSYELMEKMFKIYAYKDGSRPLVHTGPSVGIYASEGRFIHQLQSSRRFVTGDPKKAHLFFLPYSVTNMVRQIYVPESHNMHPINSFITSYVNLIASKYPYWNSSHGADHFFVSCHDWGPATARVNMELRHNAIKVVCNADVTEEFVVGKDVSLPETSLRAAKPPSRLGGPPVKKRPYLAFFAGQMHGRVRPVLLQQWKGKDPDMKIYEQIPPTIAKKLSYIRHMRMSKFCICPMGYEVNSPRLVEAIYYDCVPVIIADNFVLPFSEVLNWQEFSVSVEEREVPHLKQILLSIPDTRYASMQGSLKHVRQHFLWHYKVPVKYDIFHMILHSLWLRRLASVSVSLG